MSLRLNSKTKVAKNDGMWISCHASSHQAIQVHSNSGPLLESVTGSSYSRAANGGLHACRAIGDGFLRRECWLTMVPPDLLIGTKSCGTRR